MLFLINKSFIQQYQRRLKNGTLVTVDAHYDKRTKQAVKHAPAHHHAVEHLPEADQEKFGKMDAEQHYTHYYERPALERRLKAETELLANLEHSAERYEKAGDKKSLTILHNKIAKLKNIIARHETMLKHASNVMTGIGRLKDEILPGSGKLNDETDKAHARYVEKLGEKYKEHKTPAGAVMAHEHKLEKEGDTKEGADGQLVFRDGRWHKQNQPKLLVKVSKKDLTKDKQKKLADKLRALAQSTMDAATGKESQDRLVNTPKRVREAGNAISEALKQESLANTMFNIADAHERGETKALAEISNKTQIESLNTLLNQSMYRHDTKTGVSYQEQQNQKGRSITEEDIKFAEYPKAEIDKDNLPRLKRKLKEITGGGKLADEINELLTKEQLTQITKLLGAKEVNYEVGWYPIEQLKEEARLKAMGINNQEELQLALNEFLKYKGAIKEENAVAKMERELVGGNYGIDFFPTPKNLASKMAELANIKQGDSVLEPSAGTGNLADAAKTKGAMVDTIEISNNLRNVLKAKGYSVVANDFSTYEPSKKYDAIIMNPPFSKNQDSEHIQHAYKMLKPGGRLVAIAGEGVFFRSDSKSKDFRTWLDNINADVEKLPEKTFSDKTLLKTTGVNARLITIEKDVMSKSFKLLFRKL